jgi:hypothetical protein
LGPQKGKNKRPEQKEIDTNKKYNTTNNDTCNIFKISLINNMITSNNKAKNNVMMDFL